MRTDGLAPRRHHWVWLKPDVVLEDTGISVPDRLFLQNWVTSGRPLVAARSPSDREIRLGVTRPTTGLRQRVGVTVAPEAVLRVMPPLSLEAVQAHAPKSWQPTLQHLRAIGSRHAIDIRVYGSLALQYFAPEPCLNPDSDLDVLLEIENEAAIGPLLTELEALQTRHPIPRIDGEMRMGEWAVAWRELGEVRRHQGWLIAKSDRAVALKKEVGICGIGVRPHERRGLTPTLHIAFAAVRALHQELVLYPKPGLVSPLDNGAHTDMTTSTFFRSLFALRRYFVNVARAGAAQSSFATLKALGMAAEARMLRATAGVNTHRGAIFNLGLLAAAKGASPGASAEDLCHLVASHWGEAILQVTSTSSRETSHGRWVAQQYGIRGARWQAAQGFPVLVQQGLPAYRQALRDTGTPRRAALAAFFAIMAKLDDSNLVWRGGLLGLRFAQAQATAFLARGGVLQEDWETQALVIHQQMVARCLSPGGSADLLAALLLLIGLGNGAGKNEV